METPTSEMLTREEAAGYLGVSVATLAKWASTKEKGLRHYRPGRKVMYRKSDLDQFIESTASDNQPPQKRQAAVLRKIKRNHDSSPKKTTAQV